MQLHLHEFYCFEPALSTLPTLPGRVPPMQAITQRCRSWIHTRASCKVPEDHTPSLWVCSTSKPAIFMGLHQLKSITNLRLNLLQMFKCRAQQHVVHLHHLWALRFHYCQKFRSHPILRGQISLLVVIIPTPSPNAPFHAASTKMSFNHERNAYPLDIETTPQSRLTRLIQTHPLPLFYPE